MRKTAIFFLILILSLLTSYFQVITFVYAETDTWIVSASSDDVSYQRGSDYFYALNHPWLICGDWDINNFDYEAGMRFLNIDIPSGSIIDSAYLKVTAQGIGGVIPSTIIEGEDTDNSDTFSTKADYVGRSRTDESSVWTPPAWTTDIEYTSVDIKTIIQEIIDRGGWISGNNLTIFWSHQIGWGGVQNRIYGYTWDGSQVKAARLEITWTEPPPFEPPSDPDLLFGAGFNSSSPYVELHWNHSLIDVQFFEIQNSSYAISWDYLGTSTTTNYTDFEVFNRTARYYRVRACNFTDGSWYNSSFCHPDFEIVYFNASINGVVVIEEIIESDVPWVALAIILSIIAFLLAMRVRG